MRPAFLFSISAFLLIGIVWTALLPRDQGRPRVNDLMFIGLAGLTLGLLCVGVVSQTLMRHAIQVTPPVIALVLVARRSHVGMVAAIPLLTFWLGLMIVIWLFLLNIARIISGHFTTTEIALTIGIGLMCGLGLLGASRSRTPIGAAGRIAIAISFAGLQLGALLLSMQPLAILR